MNRRLEGRVCVVTGASSGIGTETARGLAALGAHVIVTGRNAERTNAIAGELRAQSRSEITAIVADLSSFEGVRALANAIDAPAIHVLINNAGIWNPDRRLTKDGHEETFAVNHLAPFLLTKLLKDKLVRGAPSRVVAVTSRLHEGEKQFDFDDPMAERKYAGLRAYRQSKLANVMFANELARRWSETGVTSNSVHPGDVATEVTRNSPLLHWAMTTVGRFILKSASEGAHDSIRLASDPELEKTSGEYHRDGRARAPSPAALDREACTRLWDLSEKLIDARS
jgi:retinol dehydrogenase 14